MVAMDNVRSASPARGRADSPFEIVISSVSCIVGLTLKSLRDADAGRSGRPLDAQDWPT